jgi:hypothetical protein
MALFFLELGLTYKLWAEPILLMCRRGNNFWSTKSAYTWDAGKTCNRVWNWCEYYLVIYRIIQVCRFIILFFVHNHVMPQYVVSGSVARVLISLSAHLVLVWICAWPFIVAMVHLHMVVLGLVWRVVMLFCALNNIRKTSLFPRDPQRLAP